MAARVICTYRRWIQGWRFVVQHTVPIQEVNSLHLREIFVFTFSLCRKKKKTSWREQQEPRRRKKMASGYVQGPAVSWENSHWSLFLSIKVSHCADSTCRFLFWTRRKRMWRNCWKEAAWQKEKERERERESSLFVSLFLRRRQTCSRSAGPDLQLSPGVNDSMENVLTPAANEWQSRVPPGRENQNLPAISAWAPGRLHIRT